MRTDSVLPRPKTKRYAANSKNRPGFLRLSAAPGGPFGAGSDARAKFSNVETFLNQPSNFGWVYQLVHQIAADGDTAFGINFVRMRKLE